jgi:hypothetical protein
LRYAERDTPTTNDQHVQERHWLLLDVDPDRPTGISATDNEKALAKKKAVEVQLFLKARNWPAPVIADSGNGFHLLYRIDLPTADDRLIENVLTAVAGRFNGDRVKLDRSVFNPSRIGRLYGTLAAKGDNTEERPHRLSRLIHVPEHLAVVGQKQLQELIQDLLPPVPAPPVARTGSFDIEEFLSRYGIEVAEKKLEPDGAWKWKLAHCPFNHDHVDGEAAVFLRANGVLGFHCFHSSCTDKHWQDFRRHFELEKPKNASPYLRDPPNLIGKAGSCGDGDVQTNWEISEPEPVELPPPPAPYVPPPLDLLPSYVSEYVYAVAESLNVDVAFPCSQSLVHLALLSAFRDQSS